MKPRLSVIIISYNMARELPRTIRSFSPMMQRGIQADEYELILVDNGSTVPVDEPVLCELAANLRIERMANATPSPVRAINRGLELARGELVGVCIDGARMASPGLLSTALTASALHPKPAIGALAFHLGPDVQPESVKRGYNQRVEDELLATARWEEDGYRLFQIAVFAGSSRRGWFVTPVETNAVFLRSSHWGEIGGYDEAFVSPGGGLVNLDTWRRICEDKSCGLILLLGEATFHQVHGGIATNNPVSPWDAYHDEYVRIRGEPFMAPTRTPLLFGRFSPQTAASIAASTHALSEPAP